MPNWKFKTKVAAAIASFSVYFAVALGLKYTYGPAPPLAGVEVVADLKRTFFRFDGYGVYRSVSTLDDMADTDDAPGRSPYMIYENERPLGPAHSLHNDIAKLGHGRFSHWSGVGFVFSSSDGTNPASNGRRYRVVKYLDAPSPPLPGVTVVADLRPPFAKVREDGYGFYSAVPALDAMADAVGGPGRSPYMIYENDRPLGPAHSLHDDIVKLGHGRFSHWRGVGFIFSSSDGTDPASNGRRYWVVKYADAPPPPPPGVTVVADLRPPFLKVQEGGYGFYGTVPALDATADTLSEPNRSPYMVYENDRPLGPAHALHNDIAKLGHGRFSHWRGIGFVFSSSDGSNPASNGRRYRVVKYADAPSPPLPGVIVVADLRPPFVQEGGYGFYSAVPTLDATADTVGEPKRSPYMIYENDRPLGPAHSLHNDIAKLGHGRFSHWANGFIISSSDGTNPASNGRRYWVVKDADAPSPPLPGVIVVADLRPPFLRIQEGGYGFYSAVPTLGATADTVGEPNRSPYMIYENDRPLGPAHSLHNDVAKLGHGRFSHWADGFFFSSSDGTNPASNGRRYWVVKYADAPSPPLPGVTVVADLRPPFVKVQEGGYGFYSAVPALDATADTVGEPDRSPYMIYENDRPLALAHSLHDDIVTLGHGRFSHWADGFFFSSSDGTDPASNGRRYWVVKYADAPSPPPPGVTVVADLRPPFVKAQEGGYGSYCAVPALDATADTVDEPNRSPYMIYENDRPLGPAHALHDQIAKLGHGRFSHWRGVGFIFSSSDGTDPALNGRRYWVMLPQ